MQNAPLARQQVGNLHAVHNLPWQHHPFIRKATTRICRVMVGANMPSPARPPRPLIHVYRRAAADEQNQSSPNFVNGATQLTLGRGLHIIRPTTALVTVSPKILRSPRVGPARWKNPTKRLPQSSSTRLYRVSALQSFDDPISHQHAAVQCMQGGPGQCPTHPTNLLPTMDEAGPHSACR